MYNYCRYRLLLLQGLIVLPGDKSNIQVLFVLITPLGLGKYLNENIK